MAFAKFEFQNSLDKVSCRFLNYFKTRKISATLQA